MKATKPLYTSHVDYFSIGYIFFLTFAIGVVVVQQLGDGKVSFGQYSLILVSTVLLLYLILHRFVFIHHFFDSYFIITFPFIFNNGNQKNKKISYSDVSRAFYKPHEGKSGSKIFIYYKIDGKELRTYFNIQEWNADALLLNLKTLGVNVVKYGDN